MRYAFDLWGWYTGPAASNEPRSTSIAPANTSMSDEPGALRSNWTGYDWAELPYAAPAPPPEPALAVPPFVTMRQARLALLGAGVLDAIPMAIAAIPDEAQRRAAEITWEFSSEVHRHHDFVAMLAPALGLSAAQLDQLFITAATL